MQRFKAIPEQFTWRARATTRRSMGHPWPLSDATVVLPGISGVQIDVRTILGHIFNPHRMFPDPSNAPRVFLSSAQSGTAKIRVRTSSGNIEIR